MANILKRLFSGDPTLRRPRFAGIYYPRDAAKLGRLVDGLVRNASSPDDEPKGRAVIVPHSELAMSGAVAVAGLVRAAKPARIVLMGPSQRVPFRGVAATGFEGWDTPAGWVKVEREAYEPIVELPFARQLDNAHDAEPSLEVQVPLVRAIFPDVPILPVLVGDASIGDLSTVIDRLWQDGVLLVVASELSRALPLDEAVAADAATIAAIESVDVDQLDGRELSARRIVQALLTVAEERGLSIECAARNNSAHRGGPNDSTIGYGAFVVS